MRCRQHQRCITAHAQANNMSLIDAGRIENCYYVTGQQILTIGVIADRDVGGRVTSRRRCDTVPTASEMAHLIIPAACVTGEFMNENDRSTFSRLFKVEARTNSSSVWHLCLERGFDSR